jgi:ribosomal protein S18 acetylase RimI-like enzyme
LRLFIFVTYLHCMQTEFKGVSIRTDLKSGDIGYIVYLHGFLYNKEYNYSIAFETYVAKGLYEFYQQYDPDKDCIWICEQNNSIVGFLLLMHRGNNAAQLRYFILLPEYRGIGLGGKLMELFMSWLKDHDYTSSYLWTTNEQKAAAELYKKFGFTLTEEFDSTSFGKLLIEQRYELILKDH